MLMQTEVVPSLLELLKFRTTICFPFACSALAMEPLDPGCSYAPYGVEEVRAHLPSGRPIPRPITSPQFDFTFFLRSAD